jgi:hypothetical protein
MENEKKIDARYAANGYKDRDDYFASLADDRGINIMAVHMIADMLGPSEDFDGLVSELEDFECMGLLDNF